MFIKKLFKNNYFNLFIMVFFTGLVLWLTLKDTYKEVMHLLTRANIFWILIIIGLVLLIQVCIGLTLTILTRLSNPHYKLSYGVVNAVIANFFHGITPSASGGQFVQVYIFKKQGVDISDSAGVLWMDFIIYQSTMIFTVFLLLIFRLSYFKAHVSNITYLVILGFIINSLVIVGLWTLGRFPRVYTFISTRVVHFLVKIHVIKDKEKTLQNLDAQLKKFDKGTERLAGHKKIIIQTIGLNLMRLLIYYSLPFFCAKALNIEVEYSMLLDIIALSSFVSMINAFIPIPGASGGTEATFLHMFTAIFGRIETSSIMIVWRLVTYYFVMVLGGLTFIYAKNKPDIEIKED